LFWKRFARVYIDDWVARASPPVVCRQRNVGFCTGSPGFSGLVSVVRAVLERQSFRRYRPPDLVQRSITQYLSIYCNIKLSEISIDNCNRVENLYIVTYTYSIVLFDCLCGICNGLRCRAWYDRRGTAMAGLLRVPHYRHSGEDNGQRTGPEEGIDNLLLVPESVLDMDGNQLRDDLNGLRFAFRKQYLQADLGPRGNIWICKIYDMAVLFVRIYLNCTPSCVLWFNRISLNEFLCLFSTSYKCMTYDDRTVIRIIRRQLNQSTDLIEYQTWPKLLFVINFNLCV